MDLQAQYVNSELSLVSPFASGIYTRLPITQAQGTLWLSVNLRKGGNVRILETRNQNVLTDNIPRRRHRAPISDINQWVEGGSGIHEENWEFLDDWEDDPFTSSPFYSFPNLHKHIDTKCGCASAQNLIDIAKVWSYRREGACSIHFATRFWIWLVLGHFGV